MCPGFLVPVAATSIHVPLPSVTRSIFAEVAASGMMQSSSGTPNCFMVSGRSVHRGVLTSPFRENQMCQWRVGLSSWNSPQCDTNNLNPLQPFQRHHRPHKPYDRMLRRTIQRCRKCPWNPASDPAISTTPFFFFHRRALIAILASLIG